MKLFDEDYNWWQILLIIFQLIIVGGFLYIIYWCTTPPTIEEQRERFIRNTKGMSEEELDEYLDLEGEAELGREAMELYP